MKHTRRKETGITRFEMFLVISAAAILLFFFVVVPCGMSNSHNRARRIQCASNLKQVALAMRLFANDHEGRFPWAVATNAGGSMEFTNTAHVFRHFAAASNELVTPKILFCSMDRKRERATDFHGFSNDNLSYFAGIDSRPTTNTPPFVLAGDRNIVGGQTNGALRLCTSNSVVEWTKALHEKGGNIAFSDGSVQQIASEALTKHIQQQPKTVTRFAVP